MSALEVLLKIRNKLNLTPTKLAAELGVTRTAIYNWEKGIRVPKDKQKLNIISYAKRFKINVKLDEFLQ